MAPAHPLLMAKSLLAQSHRWSVVLVGPGQRRCRWLDEEGHLRDDPALALRLACPEVAVQRLQTYLELHARSTRIDHFRIVPAPPRRAALRSPLPWDVREAA